MKKRNWFLIIVSFCIVGIILLLVGCSRYAPSDPETAPQPYWDGKDADYINVTESLSAYGKSGQDYSPISYYATRFFLDQDKSTEVVGNASNSTWELKVPKGTKDIYVHPRTVTLLAELGEQRISLEQEYPIQTDYFSIVSIYIPQLAGKYPYEKSILLEMNIVSETNQYPDQVNIVYEGNKYRFSGFTAKGDGGIVSYLLLKCEIPDLYTASMVMKYGTLQYSKLQTIVPGDKAVYTCDDETIELHILE